MTRGRVLSSSVDDVPLSFAIRGCSPYSPLAPGRLISRRTSPPPMCLPRALFSGRVAVGGMEEPKRAIDLVASALMNIQREADKRNFRKLIERLGISTRNENGTERSELDLLALVGLALSRKEPEFTGKKGRGRPRKNIFDAIDVKRADFLSKILPIAQINLGRNIKVKEAIDVLIGEHPLFPNTDDVQALQSSVSRGRTKMSGLRRESEDFKQEKADASAHSLAKITEK